MVFIGSSHVNSAQTLVCVRENSHSLDFHPHKRGFYVNFK